MDNCLISTTPLKEETHETLAYSTGRQWNDQYKKNIQTVVELRNSVRWLIQKRRICLTRLSSFRSSSYKLSPTLLFSPPFSPTLPRQARNTTMQWRMFSRCLQQWRNRNCERSSRVKEKKNWKEHNCQLYLRLGACVYAEWHNKRVYSRRGMERNCYVLSVIIHSQIWFCCRPYNTQLSSAVVAVIGMVPCGPQHRTISQPSRRKIQQPFLFSTWGWTCLSLLTQCPYTKFMTKSQRQNHLPLLHFLP